MDSDTHQSLALLGLASCWGAQNRHCDLGPLRLQQMHIEKTLQKAGVDAYWSNIIHASTSQTNDIYDMIAETCERLCNAVCEHSRTKQAFTVYGGDHSCAIATWSGVWKARHHEGDIGLIWIDAHMDSHTPESSHSGAIHGMPLATLLGYGDKRLCQVGGASTKLKPENVCLIGVRSFENEEAALLKKLGVRIYHIDECKEKGLHQVIPEAVKLVSANTVGYGISIDLDAVDPNDAPGVGSPEKGGLDAQELKAVLKNLPREKPLLGLEIAELNPSRDIDDKTANLAKEITKICYA